MDHQLRAAYQKYINLNNASPSFKTDYNRTEGFFFEDSGNEIPRAGNYCNRYTN
ncbi:hypothetical protein L21SP2_3329 [Salinispira pacifica]|uniref:Uncharacterized protein n=1 Tax=Salinispira pacifica TaxID=1307761 RepID=V5WLD7_9SPIO|nr:hypothetical protein L21SP2_3329 [Salinispira pacifica]